MDKREKKLRLEFEQLQQQLQHPDVFGRSNYPALAKRQGELARLLAMFDEKQSLAKQYAEAEKMTSSTDSELAEMAEAEASRGCDARGWRESDVSLRRQSNGGG